MLRNWLALILILMFGFIATRAYLSFIKAPVDPSGKLKAFVIQKGESTDSITKRLKAEGFIKSPLFFKLALNIKGENFRIQAGDFKLSPSQSVDEILDTLSKGSIDKWVTLIEGWRLEEIAKKLSEELGVDNEEFLKVAEEGYMFPDTYLFNPKASVEDIASIMRNNFDKKYDSNLQARIKAKGLTPEEGIILASIIEREGRSDKVRTEVAGVLLKRLKIGMKLDADATVQYAKDTASLEQNGKLDKFWKPISKGDYSGVVSKYNTYLNPGLPPGPICNPSLSAINAIANANLNTPYLFYYHDSKGTSHLAKTLEEHIENVANFH